jgi:AcrR family transcriptional regulator
MLEKRTDPRVQRTRDLIRHAFNDLLNEKANFDDISVNDIAARAGINRATFYAHYEDKYDLLRHMVREEFQSALAQKLPSRIEDFTAALYPLMLAVCELMLRVVRRCGPTLSDINGPIVMLEVQKCIHETLDAWAAQTGGCGQPHDIPVMTLSWAIWGAALQWSRGELGYSAEELSRRVLVQVGTQAARAGV